jgi:hypothetical protein
LFLSTRTPGNVNKVTTSERIFHDSPSVMAWCLKLNRPNLCDLTRLASLSNLESRHILRNLQLKLHGVSVASSSLFTNIPLGHHCAVNVLYRRIMEVGSNHMHCHVLSRPTDGGVSSPDASKPRILYQSRRTGPFITHTLPWYFS